MIRKCIYSNIIYCNFWFCNSKSCFIFFFIWINLEPLFAVIPHGEEYAGGMGVVFILGLAKIVNSSLSIGTDILNYSRLYPFSLLFIALLTVSAIILNNSLIPLWGINGAASATLFSYVLYFLCLLLFVGGKLRVGLFCRKHTGVLVLMLALFGLDWLWSRLLTPLFAPLPPMAALLADAVLKSAAMLAVSLLALRRMHVSDDVDALLGRLTLRRKGVSGE